MSEHTYPEGIKVGGRMRFHSDEIMKSCISKAADVMEETGFTPSFTRIANVVVNSGNEDVAFTKKCTSHIEAEDKEGFGGFDMTVFAYSVMAIKQMGWEGYIKHLTELRNRPEDEDLISAI